MDNLYLYLAGSITYLSKIGKYEEAILWRENVESWAKDNHIRIYNPTKTFIGEENYRENEKLIVEQNDFFLSKSNMMIVQLDYIDNSPGTIYEIVKFKTMRKPVFAFGQKEHWSPHINNCITKRFDNIEDLLICIGKMF